MEINQSFSKRLETSQNRGQAMRSEQAGQPADPVDSFIARVTGSDKTKADHHHHHDHHGC